MDLHLRILSTLFWVFMVVSSALVFPVAALVWLVTLPFDRRKVVLHRFTCFWASLYTWLNPAWPVHIEGREKIDRGETYVMVANHLSLLDILVFFRLFRHFKWVSKIENFKVPFIGWNMRLNEYIPLVRGDAKSGRAMLEKCRETLARGSSVMIFPEGTRSRDGHLQDFKPGAFVLAHQTGTKVLPIVIEGTSLALPKKGYILRGRHPIRVTVLDPVDPAACSDVAVLTETVRGRIADALGEPVARAA